MKKNILYLYFFFCSSHATVFFTEQMINSHLLAYEEQEKIAIEKDLNIVRSICETKMHGSKLFYLATAGGPGSRKSTILERFLMKNPDYQSGTYLDPDQRGLKFMAHTYYAQSLNAKKCAEEKNYSIVQKRAYEKWRAASNYIAVSLLEEALTQKSCIVHGTTLTGGHVASFFQALKEHDYSIILLLCSCEEETVKQAITYRNEVQCFYQSTPEDVMGKGKLFAKRIAMYFTYAETLYFYWSDDLFSPERLAAVIQEGNLSVYDEEAFDKFKNKYNRDRVQLIGEGEELPSWNELMNS